MKDAEPVKEKLPDVTEISTTTEMIAEILGISSITMQVQLLLFMFQKSYHQRENCSVITAK